MAVAPKKSTPSPRDPERSRERILSAALKEFSARGFAGARVDAIARRANINKRMLYHYFGDKEELFKAVLSRKISQRQAWAEALSGDPEETLTFWFEAACKDTDWVRMLEWEALEDSGQKIINEKERQEAMTRSVDRIRQRQTRGQIAADLDAAHVMLAIRSLTMFPVAFPQMSRLITGKSVLDPKFQKERMEFLKRMAVAFRPAKTTKAEPAA
jgi:TetR/AcrR family transcriptional regulator